MRHKHVKPPRFTYGYENGKVTMVPVRLIKRQTTRKGTVDRRIIASVRIGELDYMLHATKGYRKRT